MGLLDKFKDAANAAKEGVASAGSALNEARSTFADAVEASKAATEAASLNNAPTIIDPTPQDEIDRMNAGPGLGRAVVFGNYNTLESGENVFRAKVNLVVRVRLAGGEYGPESKLGMWTSSGVIRALRSGIEIPVTFDRLTGAATAVDQKAVAAELKGRKRSG